MSANKYIQHVDGLCSVNPVIVKEKLRPSIFTPDFSENWSCLVCQGACLLIYVSSLPSLGIELAWSQCPSLKV